MRILQQHFLLNNFKYSIFLVFLIIFLSCFVDQKSASASTWQNTRHKYQKAQKYYRKPKLSKRPVPYNVSRNPYRYYRMKPRTRTYNTRKRHYTRRRNMQLRPYRKHPKVSASRRQRRSTDVPYTIVQRRVCW